MTEIESSQDNIDPVAAYYYEDVGKHYCPMSLATEEELVERLQSNRQKVKDVLINNLAVRKFLRDRYMELRRRPGGSVAKMSDSYDTNRKGLNQQLTKDITTNLLKLDYMACNFKYELLEEAYNSTKHKPWRAMKHLRQIKKDEHALIYSVLKMTRGLAAQYGSDVYGIDEKDLVQAGNEAMLKTVRLFKPGQCRFYTFAYYKIKSAIQQYIMQNSRLVYLPKQKVSDILLVLQASNRLPEPLRHDVPALTRECEKISQRHMTEAQVEDALINLSGHAYALDTPIHAQKTSAQAVKTLSDSLPDLNVDIEGEVNYNRLMIKTEEALLQSLDPMEAAVIYFRFLDPEYLPKRKNAERPYQDIPLLFETYRLDPRVYIIKSREHIRTIERRALVKLNQTSQWFWRRLCDETLSKLLTSLEMQVLWTQQLEPRSKDKGMLSWGKVAKLLNRAPRDIISARRSALSKLRKAGINLGL